VKVTPSILIEVTLRMSGNAGW